MAPMAQTQVFPSKVFPSVAAKSLPPKTYLVDRSPMMRLFLGACSGVDGISARQQGFWHSSFALAPVISARSTDCDSAPRDRAICRIKHSNCPARKKLHPISPPHKIRLCPVYTQSPVPFWFAVSFIPNTSNPKGKSTAERQRIEQNRPINMSLSSGDEARKARGKRPVEMPSERIANNPNIGQVISSGQEAQKKRHDNKKEG
ncbi:hypothetical protein BO71DRAFT_31212 [Aspergillus ellipticus CBS 707.79]|uniref:Uncharacterized protein n=1 Tax=Aspergillus ellipticus CBS 707.79 TaxID=1448320 RepID=A0A319D4P2_9EURO|nr:hypothetical protein BO71DRAFT_31212 [Aspergillus ellipticus CBS 707.79]